MLEAKATKRAAIDAALADADAGVFISSAAMEAWIESWDRDAELEPPQAEGPARAW